jgi:hypothetical protein
MNVEAIAGRAIRGDHYRSGNSAFGNAGYQKAVRANNYCALDLAEANARPPQVWWAQAAADNTDFAARQGSCRVDALDLGLAVYVLLS